MLKSVKLSTVIYSSCSRNRFSYINVYTRILKCNLSCTNAHFKNYLNSSKTEKRPRESSDDNSSAERYIS